MVQTKINVPEVDKQFVINSHLIKAFNLAKDMLIFHE